ncbi:Patched-related protein 9 [Aphelenchoides fujianensis]|nr:Patched-related protein 9 [Aphelenchoides fujianensis]
MVCWLRMDQLNRRWGHFTTDYPKLNLLFSILLILICGYPLKNFHIELDIRASFSPNNSRASYENRVYKEFFNLTASPQRSFVLFSAKDNGSVLRIPHLRDVLKLDSHFSNVLREIDPSTGLRTCEPLCNLNKPFHLISTHLLESHANGSTSTDLLIDYPMSSYQGVDLFIGMNMIGAQVSDSVFPQNNSKIVSVRTIILWYFSRADTPRAKERLRERSLELFKWGQNGEFLDNVRFEIFGDAIANSEMVRGAIEATMLMSIGFFLLVIFVTIAVYQKLRRISRVAVPVIVLTAVVCPFLSCFAAFGLCTLLGFPIYTIMCVAPFLTQGVGVDDAFILLQSWSQHRHMNSLRDRMAAVFVHIGPSVTITSATNTIAFAIGFLTPVPQSVLLVHVVRPLLRLHPHVHVPRSVATLLSSANDHVEKAEVNPLSNVPAHFVWYAKFICSWKGRVSMIVVFLVLHAFSFSGVYTMKSTFEPSKAFPSDSPLANSMDSVRAVFNEFFPVNIIVNRPPDISNRTDSFPESYGQNRTLLWLRTYEKMDYEAANLLSFVGYNMTSYTPTYANVEFFLEQIGNPPNHQVLQSQVSIVERLHSTYLIPFSSGTTQVTAFQFSIITSNMAQWENRAVTEEKCREILQRYPEYNATVYDGDSAVLDLLLTVKLDLSGSLAVTVVCMTLVCSVFIHNKHFNSTSFKDLVGTISWWGADLDPVTMVDVLLATGFSVDFTAHIVHQFYAKTHPSRVVRLALSLHEMSAPMIQAGVSSLLVMLPLIFVTTYAIVAFAKTVFAVIGLGLLHGLFLMPVVMAWWPDSRDRKERKPDEIPAITNGVAIKPEEPEVGVVTPRTPMLTPAPILVD